jgi:2,4-dienoyl-CoA reductase (NADPH2)
MQMEHDGPWQSPLFNNAPATFKGPPIAASPVNIDHPGDFHRDMPRQLTVSEIQAITAKYIACAVRAQKAGFDGVDINCGSSHLIHNFLSPWWNRRTDEYGGTPQKRAKLMIDIIKGIKKACGKDFPIVICLNGFEVGRAIGVDDKECLTHGMATQNVLMAVEAGADALMIRHQWLGLHVSGFLPDYMFYPDAQLPVKQMPREYYAKERGAMANRLMVAEYKKLVSVPIILVGYVSPEQGEQILKAGEADFIGMNRGLMCDPELPHKLAEGRRDEVAPCTHCGTCLDQSKTFLRHCRLNAALGTDQYIVKKAKKAKKVVVIGGGPAGMEAARVAALRGHDVTLYEKNRQLGGLLPLAAVVKGIELEDLPALVRYLKGQLEKLGVKTELGKEVDSAFIKKLKPDVVIVATGGELVVPRITGIDHKHVITTPALHQMVKPYLKFFGPKALSLPTKLWVPFGKHVVIIGGGLHGTEIAEFLLKRGRKVTIVETADAIGEGVLDFRFGLMMEWFQHQDITIITSVKKMVITDKGLDITTKQGSKQTIEADSIIPTAPLKPNTDLVKSLKGKIPQVYAIGDCKEPNMIVDAIAGGWRVGNKI